MAIDDIFRGVSSNTPAISFILGGFSILMRIVLKKNKENIKNEVSKAKREICDDVNKNTTDIANMKDDLNRHERYFEEFFSNYLKGRNDVRYRESVNKSKKMKEGDTEENDEYS